jgi:hypothetical protein
MSEYLKCSYRVGIVSADSVVAGMFLLCVLPVKLCRNAVSVFTMRLSLLFLFGL